MPRDCKHGQQARACERCADEREIAELRALVQHQASELFELRKLRADRDNLRYALASLVKAVEDQPGAAKHWFVMEDARQALAHASTTR